MTPPVASRRLARIEAWFGTVLAVLGILVVVEWRTGNPTSAPHGGLLVLAGAPLLLLFGVALMGAGAMLRWDSRWRWVGQVLPFAVLFGLVFASEVFAALVFWFARLFAP